MFAERTSVGLDVRARSVVAAAIDADTGEVFRNRLTPGNDDVIGWVRSLPGPAAVVYEAGPTGFGLARGFAAAGIRREIAAPSKIQRPAGDRVKTDAETPCSWPGSYAWTTSSRSLCRRWPGRLPEIWSGPGKMSVVI